MRSTFLFLLLIPAAFATADAQRTSTGLSGGLSSSGSGTIFYIDPMINERALAAQVPDLTELLPVYVLRPGDIISISVQGGLNIVVRAALINASGEVSIPEVGAIKLGGIRLEEAKTVVQMAVARVILNARTSVSLERPAPVMFTVSGLPSYNGTFKREAPVRLAELLSDLNAEYFAASAEDVFSQINTREIEITDAEGNRQTVDLLPHLRFIKHRAVNPFIQNGMSVVFKPIEDRRMLVSISGAVQKPIQISWHPDDTVEDAIVFASGFRPDADSSSIMVLSQVGGGQAGAGALNTGAYKTLKLNRGDNLIVGFKKRNQFGKIKVVGEVIRPGVFPVEEGKTTLADVLKMAEGLGAQAIKKAIVYPRKAEEPGYNRTIEEETAGTGTGKIEKIRAKSGKEEAMTDPWLLPDGFRATAGNARLEESLLRGPVSYLEGLDYLQLETAASLNRSVVDLSDQRNAEALLLSDGDVILIPFDDGTIQVMGQVNSPGRYPFVDGTGAKAYVKAAGGSTAEADTDRIYIIKAGTFEWRPAGNESLEAGDMVFVDRKPLRSFESNRTFELQKKQFYLSVVSTIFGALTTAVLVLNVGR